MAEFETLAKNASKGVLVLAVATNSVGIGKSTIYTYVLDLWVNGGKVCTAYNCRHSDGVTLGGYDSSNAPSGFYVRTARPFGRGIAEPAPIRDM